jgi:DNA-binding IclR family transcriptional regulator
MARQHPNVAGTQSIERTVALLRELATTSRHGNRLVDIAARTQIEYPTAHRMLQCLLQLRLVEKDPLTRRYCLGPLVFELGLAATPRVNLREVCEPMMGRLAEKTGDTVFLNVRSALDAVCIDRREGGYPIKALVYEVGARRPLGVGAGGLALLMRLPWQEIQHIVTQNGGRLAAYGRLSTQSVLAALKRARDSGYVSTASVIVPGVASVALPFAGEHGLPWAAVTISTVSSRMPAARQRELVGLLRAEISEIEKNLRSSSRADVRAA